jgi:hypothetical protein
MRAGLKPHIYKIANKCTEEDRLPPHTSHSPLSGHCLFPWRLPHWRGLRTFHPFDTLRPRQRILFRFCAQPCPHRVPPDVARNVLHMIPRTQNVIVVARLPKCPATRSPMFKPGTLLERINELQQITRWCCALHHHVNVIRHDAIRVQGEMVPRASRQQMRKDPTAPRLFSEYRPPLFTAHRNEINLAAVVLLGP